MAGRQRATVKAKVVLLGEGAVGKTSIVLRYVENKFNDKHLQTLQVSLLGSFTISTGNVAPNSSLLFQLFSWYKICRVYMKHPSVILVANK